MRSQYEKLRSRRSSFSQFERNSNLPLLLPLPAVPKAAAAATLFRSSSAKPTAGSLARSKV